MKQSLFAFLFLLLGCGVAMAQTPASQARNFHGQIMDSMCAMMGGHAPNGYEATHTHTPKDCTLACVKAGSDFVLYNAKTKTTYKLDNQTMPREFAGEPVVVHGTYNPKSKTIHVEKITKGR